MPNIFNFYKKNLIDNKKIKLPEFKNINNASFHLFLIKINFPTRFPRKVYYRNNDYDSWNIRTRTIVNGEPGCL